ncbi:MAG: potassium transporter TrkG, partial [Tepidanaerobacteraceae bacterium]
MALLVSIILLTLLGLGLRSIKPVTSDIYARDGFAIVALGWLFVSVFGGLPFLISGAIPSVMDALFESASAFSTTGASILKEVEGLPKGILFWRSSAHWMGGMGVLILMIAVLPSVKANTLYIMKAETPGPVPEKFVPKVGQTAKILYVIYIAMTAIEVIFLLAGGMSLYDALIHAFGTASTGGFSNRNASIGAYNSVYIDAVVTIFMLLFGVNFTVYYALLKVNVKSILRDEELKFYLGTVITATV